MSIGGGSNKSTSTSGSTAQSNNSSAASSFVNPTQLPYLAQMYQQAQQFANPGGAQRAVGGVANRLDAGFQTATRNLTGLTDPSAQIRAQTSSLKSGLGSLFRDEINPALETSAIAAGGLGGGRQGVAQGVATGQLADAFTQGVGDIVAGANNTAIGAAGQLPQLSQGWLQSVLAGQTGGLDVMGRLASILGSPTILNRSTSGGQSLATTGSSTKSGGKNFSLGFEF